MTYTSSQSRRPQGFWGHGAFMERNTNQPVFFFLSNKSPQNVEVYNKNSCYFTVSMGQYLGLAWVGSLLWDSHTT